MSMSGTVSEAANQFQRSFDLSKTSERLAKNLDTGGKSVRTMLPFKKYIEIEI